MNDRSSRSLHLERNLRFIAALFLSQPTIAYASHLCIYYVHEQASVMHINLVIRPETTFRNYKLQYAEDIEGKNVV